MRDHHGDDEPAEANPLSPAGQLRQLGDLTLGWTTNPRGRRRAVRMLLWLAVAVLVASGLVLVLA